MCWEQAALSPGVCCKDLSVSDASGHWTVLGRKWGIDLVGSPERGTEVSVHLFCARNTYVILLNLFQAQ